MRYCGISEFFHNAGIAFIDENGNIEFASESERYYKTKNHPRVHKYLIDMIKHDDHISFYEDHSLRSTRENHPKLAEIIKDIRYSYDTHYEHHQSHVFAAYYTRPWTSTEDTVMLSIDGAGELQSATIYDSDFNLVHQEMWFSSIGIIYAEATKALGYKALEEEYIVMGMAAFGEPSLYDVVEDLVKTWHMKQKGTNYSILTDLKLDFDHLVKISKEDFAASIQKWAEVEILKLAKIARKYGNKLCYSGGVAQNIVANSKIRELFDDMWIAINPADGGSSIGAAARSWALDTGKNRLNWKDAYLGYDEKSYVNPKHVAGHLDHLKIGGVINGPAEFGPRALGNRSLLADPRIDIKDTVNRVKNREEFRPFAPAILEEFADEYFEGHMNEYMQYTAKAKHDYKSVTHIDGTSRVQIVRKDSRSIIRPILEEFYELTGVPMLLNTSLNVRGKPICNDKYDGKLFEVTTDVKVFGS